METTTAPPRTKRVTGRSDHSEEQRAILSAWGQCRSHGLASLSLRQLAAAVGMRARSLYSYFDSKNAIFDGRSVRLALTGAAGN
ncbi:MAG: helix-turn-helix domain-containing protein [Ilumatobacter fluminis]|uniref:helix-turn-helix domain-containing protein n=1 Tax=Ilumatobacter fluminis TaxID=467091 RepID=UPI0032ED7A13